MKKFLVVLLSSLFVIQLNAQFNWGSIVEKVSGLDSDSTATGSTIGNILGDIVSTDKIELNQLVGTWDYSSPAVSFQSDNILKKVGGSVASSTIEDKLKVYYEKAGLTNLSLTIDESSKFTMKAKYATLQGTIEKGENGTFIFKFNAFGQIKIGQLVAYTSLSGNTLSLTFDVKKLIELAKMISQISNSSTVKGAIQLFESYDGVNAGFKLKKS